MRLRRPAFNLSLLLAGVFILSTLLASCQGSARSQASTTQPPTQTPMSGAAAAGDAVTHTPEPTRTKQPLPPTWTPTPRTQVSEPTASPTPTATPHNQQTLSAQATFDKSTKCIKRAEAWQLKVRPSWKGGWCDAIGIPGTYYEYQLMFPQEWEINTFGDLYPNVVFITPLKGVELRLYSVFNYETKKFYGKLEDAPKQSFCDKSEKCLPIIETTEKITKTETRNIGLYRVLIIDSVDGKQYIRRYFFQVFYRDVQPRINRLFFFKLYTPEPYNDKQDKPLQDLIEDVLDSIKPRTGSTIP